MSEPDDDDLALDEDENDRESLAAAAEAPEREPPEDEVQIPADTSELQFQLDRARDVLNPDREFDPTRTIVPPPTEEEQTVNMLIDEDLMRLALTDETGMTSTMVLQGKSSGAGDEDEAHDGDGDGCLGGGPDRVAGAPTPRASTRPPTPR